MWNHLDEFERMLSDMDLFRSRIGRVFNEFDRSYRHRHPWITTENVPHTNLYDKGDNLVVSVELPGYAKEDISLKVQGNYLEIQGKRAAAKPEGYTVHRTERGAASFSRSFTLPYEVDADSVEASLKNGILTMTLPKSEAAKPKQIAVN